MLPAEVTAAARPLGAGPSNDRGRRGAKWRPALIAAAAAVLLIASACLIDRLPTLLVCDQRWDRADYVLVLGSGATLDEAAERYLAGRTGHVLLVGRRTDPVVRLGIVPSYDADARQRLVTRGVPQQAIEIIAAQTRTTWDRAAALEPWLPAHPGARVDVLSDRLESTRDRYILDHQLPAAQSASLRVSGVPDPAISERGWWRHRYSLKAVAAATVALVFDWLHGPPATPKAPRGIAAEGMLR